MNLARHRQSGIARDIAEVEPILRTGATHEIDATQPLVKVVDTLIAIAHE